MATYTVEQLREDAFQPLFGWILARGLATPMTYGEIAARLEQELDIPKIFSTHIGKVAGWMMDRIFEVDEDAPLINMLIVDQGRQLPGKGVTNYLVDRFGKRYANYFDLTVAEKSAITQKAQAEVRAYSGWAAIYRELFDREPPLSSSEFKRRREKDGKSPDGRSGGGGEGEEHRRLKAYVAANPRLISGVIADDAVVTTEAALLSGDTVDVRFEHPALTVLAEVKSRISNDDDLIRGLYQVVKYEAVAKAQAMPTKPRLQVVLVVENELSNVVRGRAQLLDIEVKRIVVPGTFKPPKG